MFVSIMQLVGVESFELELTGRWRVVDCGGWLMTLDWQ